MPGPHPGITGDLPGPASPSPGRTPAATEEASGSVNRLLRPDSVRHMSVTTAMQRLTMAHHDTRCDSTKAAREPGYTPVTGRFRRWWQVLGSNQRRLSRRFYRPLPLAARATCRAPPLPGGTVKDSGQARTGSSREPGPRRRRTRPHLATEPAFRASHRAWHRNQAPRAGHAGAANPARTPAHKTN